jgi:hypothetical protein
MSQNSDWNPELSANDRRLLDALVEAGFDHEALEPLTDQERARVDRLLQTFGLLNDYPVDLEDVSWDSDDDTLIHATLARIGRHDDERASRMSLTEGESRRGRRWGLGIRLQDFVAVAAMVLLGASVALPMLNMAKQSRIDQACANNMRHIGYAFSSYADDHNGQLPIARAGIGHQNLSWDTIANTINLAPLIDGQYCSRGHVNCPGNHDNLELTYSYQFQRPDVRINWMGRRTTVILGDRNPLIDAARSQRLLPAMTMSRDHGGRGQNVLRTDGVIMWLGDEPVVGRVDNIWLPHGYKQLEPGAAPEDKSDVFLAH